MKSSHITIAIAVLIFAGMGVLSYIKNTREVGGEKTVAANTGSGDYDSFAQCLADKGATFYGAFWCPHCQEQKRMLHESKKLPYIECSNPDGKSQNDVCKKENIKGYPTWRFTDGSELAGEQTVAVLSQKTGCTAP